MAYNKQNLLWLLVTYLQSFTDLWTRRVYVILVSVKVVFWVKAISYTFFGHYFALSSNTTGWNLINRYHAITFLCLSLTPVFRFRLVAVLLVSVLSRLRFVNGIVCVVSYLEVCQRNSCCCFYLLCHSLLFSCIFSVLLYFVFSFIGIATVVPDPCPSGIKNSDIGNTYLTNPFFFKSVYVILNTETGACNMHDYPIIQIERWNIL